jgi:hypothetical protein
MTQLDQAAIASRVEHILLNLLLSTNATHKTERNRAVATAELTALIREVCIRVIGEVPPRKEVAKYADHLRGRYDERLDKYELLNELLPEKPKQ